MDYKNLLLVSVAGLFLISVLSCKNEASTENVEIDEIESDSIDIVEIDTSLNGVWVLTNYFDTIVKHKQVAKYRLQVPTWFGIILEIDGDSIRSYGSLGDYYGNFNDVIDVFSDTLMHHESKQIGCWYLIRNDKSLLLLIDEEDPYVDSTKYIYERDLSKKYMAKDLSGVFKIGHHVTNYFNEKIMSGKYRYLNSNKIVEFMPDGSLIGFEEFNEYEVRNYFGTLHMHKNLDVITFKSPEKFEQYNWVFTNDRLVLTKFIDEEIMVNGKRTITDYFVPGDKTITLIKIED